MLTILYRAFLVQLALLSMGISAAYSQAAGKPQVNSHGLTAETALYANGAMIAIFFHEMGHMLIRELNLPLTGPEEDVVDEFSSLMLSAGLKASAPEQKYIFVGSLIGIASFWKIAAIEKKQKGVTTPYYDEHSPDERRFANILCIGIGADPLQFAPIATREGFSDARMQRCNDDYKRHEAAWEELMEKYEKKKYHGTMGPIEIVSPKNAALQDYAEQLRLFSPILEGLSKSIKLPRNIPVIAMECGFTNAFYNPNKGTITICYEMYDRVVRSFAKLSEPAADDKPMPPSVPNTTSRSLYGSWRCQAPGGEEQLVLRQDGAFQSTVFTGVNYIQAWGRWSQSQNVLTYNIASSNVPMPPVLTFSFAMPDNNTLQIGANFCRRASN